MTAAIIRRTHQCSDLTYEIDLTYFDIDLYRHNTVVMNWNALVERDALFFQTLGPEENPMLV